MSGAPNPSALIFSSDRAVSAFQTAPYLHGRLPDIRPDSHFQYYLPGNNPGRRYCLRYALGPASMHNRLQYSDLNGYFLCFFYILLGEPFFIDFTHVKYLILSGMDTRVD